MQRKSITRRPGAPLTAAVITAVVLAATAATAADPAAPIGWRAAAEYLAMFAPPAHRDAYAISVTASPLGAVLRALEGDGSLLRAPGSWQPRAMSATDAFGTSGPYNRWTLARLYRSRQAQVARGVRTEAGQIGEAWTLISPYPSPDLQRLEPGTLRIVLRIAPTRNTTIIDGHEEGRP